jgi:GT2 family glycosyltransferase
VRRAGYLGSCWPDPLAEGLLRAAILPPDDAAAAWAAIRSQLVLDDLWDPEVHRLLPLVHANLRDVVVDDPDLPRLKGLHRRTWYENQLALHHVRPALDELHGAGITVLFLKGAPLALQHYGDLGLRPMADIDILVPWDEAARALDVLEHAGWVDTGGRSRAQLFQRYHGSGLEHPDGGQLDVHWHLGTPLLLPDDERASNDDFWAAAVPFVAPAHGIDALTLCPTDMLLHVIAHGLWAGSASTVRWVADARVVIGAGDAIDWPRLVDQATRRRIAPLVGDALRYLAEVVDAPVPAQVVDELRASQTTRRERGLLRALAGSSSGPAVPGGVTHLRAYWAYTRLKWGPARAARELPAFIADVWGLERTRDIPAAAATRVTRAVRPHPPPAAAPAGRVARPAVAVVVPTHQRSDDLARCLDALDAQTSPPEEVIVVRGPDDQAAGEVIAGRERPPVEILIDTGTVIDRLHAAAARANAPIIAFTDDDASPHPDWIERLQEHFTDPTVGAVGGRDLQPGAPAPFAERVGLIGPGGRLVADHSHGVGSSRDVDHLRGVNMAVRRELLRFPTGLRGQGALGYNELSMCLAVRAAGRRVVYDPGLLVDHRVAPRSEYTGGDRVNVPTARRLDDAYNQTYTLLSMRPGHRLTRMLYVVLIGDRSTGGLARCGWAALRGDWQLAGQLVPLLAVQRDAWRESRRRPLRGIAPDEPYPTGQ